MNNTVSATPTPEQQRYADAIESALWIIHYYEGDRHEFLMEQSVICNLTDDFNYSAWDAQSMLHTATTIHRYRTLSGFYN